MNTVFERLQSSLQTTRFGKRIFFAPRIESTSDWARQLAEAGAEEGTVTVAQTQTGGRGRLGRQWISPQGGLWFSIILRPRQEPHDVAKLVFVTGLAVAEALHKKYGLRTETKWPNDVLINGKKVCGILSEMNTKGQTVNYVIVGVGVNANLHVEDDLPESLKTTSTSIMKELSRKIRLGTLLKVLLEEMERIYDYYLKNGFALLLEKWKKHAVFLGRKVTITNHNERLNGLALDVDVEGALILKLEDETTRRILTGDVALIS